MKPFVSHPGNLLLIFCLVVCLPAAAARAETIRKPKFAGSFYPDNRSHLAEMIEDLTRQAGSGSVAAPSRKPLKALILPHAGYVYSGLTAAHASRVLHRYQFKKVVVMAPDHRVGFSGGAVSDVVAYETPLGLLKLHDDSRKLRRKSELFHAVEASDQYEHSLEVVLPFLQYYLKEFELVPIVLSRVDVERVGAEIDPVVDKDTLLVVSSDLSHYLTYSQARARDRETMEAILSLDDDKLKPLENAACGKTPVLVAMNLARRRGWKPMLLHYSNSGDTAGGRDRVVGYAAIAFYGDSVMQNSNDPPRGLNGRQGQALVRLARQTIAEKLGRKRTDIDPGLLEDRDLSARRGTFVTLTIDGQLRGCIGSLEAAETILEGVRRNAVNAAFHDPRFPELGVDELDRADIEISILTEPRPLAYKDGADLLARLRPHVDGVILRKGSASATFLPQVWDQLPDPEKFLSHLCRKAGLSADTWKKSRLEILTYQVQYFEEEK